MDEIGGTGNGTQGIGGYHHFPGIEGGYVELMNSFVEAGRSAVMGDMMEDRDQLGLDPNVNYKLDMPQINEAIESPAFSSQNSANATLSDSNPDPSAGIFTERASDLLLVVSLGAEPTRTKITDLSYSAMDELAKIAVVGEPLWRLQKKGKYETLNDIEYLKEFGHVDATLREIMKMVEVGEPEYLPSFDSSRVEYKSMLSKPTSIEALQIEASRDIAYVKMNPINIVELLMDLGQWSRAFYKIVSRAMVLGILCDGVEGSYDGKLQVMSAEFHLPTPLVATRKCYFARYCKQLSHDVWGVVDVSLDKLFPDPSANFQRRPSGCLIKEMPLGYSKVTWVEHVEADYRGLNINFKPLVTSGFAFSATRWITYILRHFEWCETLKATTTPTADGVLIPQTGRTNLLKLAERMMRSFCLEINASTEKQWMELPFSGSEEVRFRIEKSMGVPGKPPDSTVVFATSLSLPTSPSPLFHFLRDENSRNKWDLLSRGFFIRELAYVVKGKDPGNRVSIMQVNSAPDKIAILYLQESYTDSTGCYVIYAPVDELALSAVLNGGNPDHVAVLPSGFAILPDEMPGEGEEEHSGGSLLTIAFHIVDSASDGACIPHESVKTIQKIITETIVSIKAAMLYNNLLENWMEE